MWTSRFLSRLRLPASIAAPRRRLADRRWTRRPETAPVLVGSSPGSDDLIRRLEWPVLRRIADRLGGIERSTARGPGVELHDLREYQPGDDVRTIDWNVTARTDRPYVREAELERALDVWLVADVSASVAWGTASALKSDRAGELAAATGLILGRRGHRIGTVLFDDRPIAFIPPGAGRGHVTRLLIALREGSGRVSAGSTDLAAALDRTGLMARRRALILVVSDFLVRPGWQPALDRLARRHEVVAVRVADPREGDLPDIGLVTLEDPETGGQLLVDTGDAGLRARYRAAATAQAERLAADLTVRGVDLLTVRTDESLLPALAHFLATRRHRRGRPGPTSGLRPAG